MSDMSNQNVERVIVLYPPELADYSFFCSKMQRLDKSLGHCAVVSPHDQRGFCNKYFGARFQLATEQTGHRRQRAALVQSCTHIVVFWDGSEVLGDFVFLAHIHARKIWTIPVETTRVVNKDAGHEFDVYIGRRGPWGNPFVIGIDGTRDEVIEKYKTHFSRLLRDEQTKEWLLTLKGKRLGCHCKPASCHGDVIAEYLNTLQANSVNGETGDAHVNRGYPDASQVESHRAELASRKV